MEITDYQECNSPGQEIKKRIFTFSPVLQFNCQFYLQPCNRSPPGISHPPKEESRSG